MKFSIISELATRYPVKALCQKLQVSRSGYYAWCKRGPSRRQQENEQLVVEIRAVHEHSRGTWGNFFLAILLPVTIGNIISGAVKVGLVYWFIYLRPSWTGHSTVTAEEG